ncbi:hypothetical protein [Aeoliella sp.]|uniref:hypothetical protein n=1 Tax=Aeoliella sp. TaxID=2795800 RepID=UPI003CCC3609
MSRRVWCLTWLMQLGMASATAAATSAYWDTPQLDRWIHQGESSQGFKDSMSTFASLGVGGTQSGGPLQSRSGVFALAFDTSLPEVAIPQVAPGQYQIDSIRFTAQLIDNGAEVYYDPTRDYVDQITGGTDDAGRPIELYGVGFGNGYTKFGFGPNDAQTPEFEEASPATSSGSFAYNIYPLGERPDGSLGNVFNSPGGEGIFVEQGGEYELVELTTPAWNPAPWAIGTVEGASAGQLLTGMPTFEFDIDLDVPGVREYFQQGLSEGQVSVMISSLHEVSSGHTGDDGDFPAFYSKDHPAVSLGLRDAATLTIEYSILALAGDYDGNGFVDQQDYLEWKSSFGASVEAFSGADGNGDGLVGLADFSVWRNNLGAGTPPAGAVGAVAVPEPSGVQLCGIVGLTLAFCSWVNWFAKPSLRSRK